MRSLSIPVAIASLLLTVPAAQAVDNVATNSGDWEDGGIWSLGIAPQASHDVSIPSTNTIVTMNGLSTRSISSLTITGTLTHAANADVEAHKIVLDVAGDVTVGSNGMINASEKGYGWLNSVGYGPAGVKGRAGAGHGGEGSDWLADGQTGGGTYGSVTNPVSLGSGGAGRQGNNGNGSAGGGAIILTVGGVLTLDAAGRISADGGSVSDRSSGAGGSVNISASSFAGTGIITAIGGTANGGRGASGGGRIALIAGTGTLTQFDSIALNARGGDGATQSDGGAGTIYLKVPTQSFGSLVIKNNGASSAALTTWTNEVWRFDSITTLNYGALAVGTNAVLDLTGTALSSDSTPSAITSRIVFGPETGRFVWPAVFSNTAAFSQSGTNLYPFPGDLVLADGGVLTYQSPGTAVTAEDNRLNVSIAGALTIHSNAAINAFGKGYGFASGVGYGPGGSRGRWGAAHGGQGAAGANTGVFGQTYGSVLDPINHGSGCGGLGGVGCRGGGAVVMRVGGAATIDGLITVEGDFSSDRSMGSGGSINISAASFAGTGTINAKGARGNVNAAGAGGGRIALKAGSGDSSQFDSLTITAAGGGSDNAGFDDPSAGTVYLQTASQGEGKGVVWVNNDGSATNRYTSIPAETNAVPNELEGALVIATNSARILASASTTIGDLLVRSNCFWELTSSYTLTVDTLEHSLDDLNARGPGATERVDDYARILWAGSPPGTVLMVR